MMTIFSRFTLYLLLISAPIVSIGQDKKSFPLYPRAITVQATNQSAVFKSTSSETVIEKARFGHLLDQPSGEINQNGNLNSTALQLTFHLTPKDSSKNFELLFGIATETLNTNWSDWEVDTTGYQLKGKYENFQLGTGMHYFLKKDKVLQLGVGAEFYYAIPISSVTIQEITNPTVEYEEIKLFGSKGTSFRVSIPILFHLKLFGTTYLKFAIRPGFNQYKMDGVSKTKWVNGSDIGLKFYLK